MVNSAQGDQTKTLFLVVSCLLGAVIIAAQLPIIDNPLRGLTSDYNRSQQGVEPMGINTSYGILTPGDVEWYVQEGEVDLLYNPFASRTAEQRFSKSVRSRCLEKADGRDMITGEDLKPGFQFHHIRPVQFGGLGTEDNCIVVNLDTHSYIHEKMSNGKFSLKQFFEWLDDPSLAAQAKIDAWLQEVVGGVIQNGKYFPPW